MIFPKLNAIKKNSYKKTVNGFIPKEVYIPLNQDSEIDGKCLVKPGEHVEEGQLLAKYEDKECLFPHLVYSSVPGTVEEILLNPSPCGKNIETVKIRLQGSFKYLGKKNPETDVKNLTQSEIILDIAKKGILNTFVTDRPEYLAENLEKIRSHKNRLVIVRLFDDDPSRMIDGILSNLYQDKINEGIRILIKALDADGVILVTDNNFEKPEIFNPFDIPTFFLKLNSRDYPSTYKKNICTEIRRKSKSQPFNKITKYDLFVDATTVLELQHCVKFNTPAISRFVHVNGACIPASGILKVPVGTTFRMLAEQCGGFLKNPEGIIVNGMISGVSAGTLDAPVTKYVKSVTFIPKMQCPDQRQTVCIRCGNCRRVCPNKLSPDIIYRYIRNGMNASADYLASADFCSDCGLCNSVCPSRLPLSQRIYEFAQAKKQKGTDDEKQ